ncbi:MAG: DUF6266 family protein [Pedobacter sp.]
MAKIKQGLFGPLTGKLGSVVGSSWMGIPYLKKAQKYVKNPKRSPAQKANNQKFAYVNEWLVPFHAYIVIGFDTLAIGKTALAAALSSVYNTVFSGTMPELAIDYSQMQISKGSLRGLSNVTLSYVEPHLIDIRWDDNSGPYTHFDDQVMAVFYNEELKVTDGFIGNVNRTDRAYQFALDPQLIGKPLHAYIATTSFNRKKASDTIYLGLLPPL